jgi:hypothetical protein
MADPETTSRTGRASGEVSERGELLDGSLQLALEGSCELADVEWIVSMTLAWPLAEAGEVPLAEGDLSLDAPERGLFAVLDEGVVVSDPDTGAAQVTASFLVDATDGETAPAGEAAVAGVECSIEVDVEAWRGELTLVEAG